MILGIYLTQPILDLRFVPYNWQTFHALSSYCQKPPTIFWGMMAALAGSYQYLQKAQILLLRIFVEQSIIFPPIIENIYQAGLSILDKPA